MLTFLNIAWKKMVKIGAVQFRCNYPGKGDWSSVRGGGLLIGCLPLTKSFRKIRLECKWHTTFRVVLVETFREQRNDWKGRPRALTICAENSVIPGRIQMDGSSQWNIFGKKVIPFEVLPFSHFYRIYRNFLYHLFGSLGPLLSTKTFRNLQYLICCREVLFVGGKTRNIAIQLVFKPCCRTKCIFVLPVLPKL